MNRGLALRSGVLARLRSSVLDPERKTALKDASLAWLISRLLCWGAGLAAVLIFGLNDPGDYPQHLTAPFGDLANKLVAPTARWDSVWFVRIADEGYDNPLSPAYFPLFPLLSRAVGAPLGSSLLGGLVVALASFLVALYLLHRLTSLELGRENAQRAVLVMAFFPTSLFFSAVYAESLFLALGIGAFYAARTGRWAWAGVLGGLATMTRPPGLVLLVPLVLLYLYGPRGDRPAATPSRGLRPRYAPSLDALWLLAVPAGIVCQAAYLWVDTGDASAAFRHQSAWDQEFAFLPVAVWNAAEAAGSGVLEMFRGRPPDNVYEFGYICLACVAAVGLFRRLPIAYGAYFVAGVALILSYPIDGAPAGFSRYVAVLFPIAMWLAAWSDERRLFKIVLVVFAVLMMVNSARFATWHFVA